MDTGVNNLITKAYIASEDPSKWADFLEDLADALHGFGTSILVYNTEAFRGNLAVTVRVDPDITRLYNEHYSKIDPWWVHGKKLVSEGVTVSGQQLIADSELERSEFYQDLMRKGDSFHLCAGILQWNGPLAACVSSFRPKRLGAFCSNELDLLRVMVPHLHQAVQIHNKFMASQLKVNALSSGVDHLQIALILLNSCNKVIHLNLKAEELLRKQDGLMLKEKALRATTPADDTVLRKSIADAINLNSRMPGEPPKHVSINRSSGRPLSVFVAPVLTEAWPSGFAWPSVVVFISDPDVDKRCSAELLVQQFSFSPAEVRLALLLLEGKSLDECANCCNITKNTVRTQLAQLMSKTDTHRQSELLRVLWASTLVG